MTDKAEASPSQGSLAGAGVLLATKLHVPRPPPGFVRRPHLLELLNEEPGRPLTLVSAPAGFGKTALLADWARRGSNPVAWLSLDADDNDPARFWNHVGASLDRMRPGTAERVAATLGPPPSASFEETVAAVVNELAEKSGDAALILDDYHVIDTDPIHASLAYLLQHAPPGLRVVLAGRADPPLPLSRMRVRGQLAELRAADLRFSTDEAAALLRQAAGVELDADSVANLTARTEGWAAGLQLAALSLQDHADSTGFVESFSGSHRYVLDYLTEEVLERQPRQVRDFLLETSVLDRLSGPLCDAVTGGRGSQQMLEAIEHANVFLMPLDEVRGWWRYHQLFADLLRARLQREQPGRLADLHRRAAAWHEAHGLAGDAVRHALAAPDAPYAARLVERHFDDFVLVKGESATVLQWLSELPRDLVDARPRLLLGHALLEVYAGRLDGADALLTRAEHLAGDAADEGYEPSVGREASLVANLPAAIASTRAFVAQLRGVPEATIAFTARALEALDAGQWRLEATVGGHLATAEWLYGRLESAERGFLSSIMKLRAAGAAHATAGRGPAAHRAAASGYYLGQIQCAQGRLDAALETHRQALEVAAPPDEPPHATAGVAYLGLAEAEYRRDGLDAATRYATDAIPLCRRLHDTQFLAAALATRAWIHQANGDAGAALAVMVEAERMAKPAVTDLLDPVPAQLARLQLAQGDTAAAARWVARRGLGADDEPLYPQEPAYLVFARVLLAEQRPRTALELLDRLRALATSQGRFGSLIEIDALRSLALYADDDEAAGLTALAGALVLARPQGHVRVFVDEGAPMAALFGRLVATKRLEQADLPLSYLGRLTRAFARLAGPTAEGGASAPAATAGMITIVSERELEVLGLLAAGRTNQQIAGELYLAVDTVKKHITHILDKLGATNRTEAATRARELGLLD